MLAEGSNGCGFFDGIICHFDETCDVGVGIGSECLEGFDKIGCVLLIVWCDRVCGGGVVS